MTKNLGRDAHDLTADLIADLARPVPPDQPAPPAKRAERTGPARPAAAPMRVRPAAQVPAAGPGGPVRSVGPREPDAGDSTGGPALDGSLHLRLREWRMPSLTGGSGSATLSVGPVRARLRIRTR